MLPGAGRLLHQHSQQQPFGLSALGKMINIISLTSSKFDVYKAILAKASCRLAGPDGNTALTFNIDIVDEQRGCAGSILKLYTQQRFTFLLRASWRNQINLQ